MPSYADALWPLLVPTFTLGLVVALLVGAHVALEWKFRNQPERSFVRHLILLALTLLGLLAFIVVLPVTDSLRGQILGFLGILLSTAIALSSTTLLGNALAGLMLRAVRSFHSGDFIHAGEHFGRVAIRGLFHVEIQGEDRSLTTLPNLFLATSPVKVVRASGAIVSAEISLGYDVSRTRAEELLLDAASQVGLEEPFVFITRLGDFAVGYRVSGLLRQVPELLSVRSRLLAAVLDAFHAAGIEIVSPSFMNTRPVASQRFIPPPAVVIPSEQAEGRPEEIVFDKAEQAQALETRREALQRTGEQVHALEAQLKASGDADERARLEHEVAALRRTEESLRAEVEAMAQRLGGRGEETR